LCLLRPFRRWQGVAHHCVKAAWNLLGPKMPGEAKYVADGVLARYGCVYFAPYDADKVLRIG